MDLIVPFNSWGQHYQEQNTDNMSTKAENVEATEVNKRVNSLSYESLFFSAEAFLVFPHLVRHGLTSPRSKLMNSPGEEGGGIDISLGGDVRSDPSYPDPV